MKLSMMLFIGAGAWWAVQKLIQATPTTGSCGAVGTFQSMASVDAMFPGGPTFFGLIPATSLYLAGAGAVLKFGFHR